MTRGLSRAGRPGTEIFPESGKELGRRVGLKDIVFIWKSEPKDDGAGVYEPNWVKREKAVRANFESYKRAKPRGVVASKIDEFTDHIAYIDPGTDVEPPDRLERQDDGTMWEVIAKEKRTGEPTIQLEIKQVQSQT